MRRGSTRAPPRSELNSDWRTRMHHGTWDRLNSRTSKSASPPGASETSDSRRGREPAWCWRGA
eukprot:13969662-Alexandrium_andersonii.AAC.1